MIRQHTIKLEERKRQLEHAEEALAQLESGLKQEAVLVLQARVREFRRRAQARRRCSPQEPWWVVALGMRSAIVYGRYPADIGQLFGIRRGNSSSVSPSPLVPTSPVKGAHGHAARFMGPLGFPPWYAMPGIQQGWLEKQRAIHAWWGELLLDLVFVGVAFALGDVVKASFSGCKGAYGSDVSYNATVRVVAIDSVSYDNTGGGFCVGLSSGLLHAAAYFFCMYRAWAQFTQWRARFQSPDVAHFLGHLCAFMLLVFAAEFIRPDHAYSCQCSVTKVCPLAAPAAPAADQLVEHSSGSHCTAAHHLQLIVCL